MKRILLIADVPNWAYDIICHKIKKHLKKTHQIDIMYDIDFLHKGKKVDFLDYDVVYSCHWRTFERYRKKCFLNWDPSKMCVGIHGHNSWLKNKIPFHQVERSISSYRVGTISRILYNSFSHSKRYYTPSGFDPDELYETDFTDSSKIVIGWCGDPTTHHQSVKGYWDIIKPAINHFSQYYELKIQSKEDFIPHHRMREFYEQIDLYICMSSHEGSPLPVIEAMACGKPVVSTNVGVVPELVSHKYNGFIINRTIPELMQFLRQYKGKKETLIGMGKNALNDVASWTWQRSADHYEKMFLGT